MAKITVEEYLDMKREMTGEQLVAECRTMAAALSGEQWAEIQKIWFGVMSPKQRWELQCWSTDQDQRVEEVFTTFRVTFPDGETVWRSVSSRNGVNTDPSK